MSGRQAPAMRRAARPGDGWMLYLYCSVRRDGDRAREDVDAGARHIVISPAAAAGTLDVVTLAAEEVLPRLTVRAQVA